VAILVLFLSSTIISSAQDKVITEIDSICNTALELPFDEGIALITSNFEKCRNSGQESMCLLKLYFTAGYMYQLASNESSDNQKALLTESIAYYNRAHAIDPNDISVINNMFLVSKALGNFENAINILDQAIKADKKNKTKYDINKGDIYYDSKDFKKAVEFYTPAFFANTNNEGLGWKIIYSYTQLPNQNEAYEGLVTFSGKLFDQEVNDLARNGYLYAVKNALAINDNEKAVQACVSWAETIARKNTITGSYVDELPDLKTWTSPCNKELQMLLMNSFGKPENIKWWTANDFRRHITATILLKMKSAALIDGDIEIAVQMLETALDIAPEFYRYEGDPKLKKYFPVKLDIAIELSGLYNRYPKLDLNKAKYEALIRELFNEKSMHYLQNDLESIQKSHTMLGLIYADRNVWKSSWFAGNAIFQLENAIKFQKRIESKNPEKFKPVPSLYQMLAKGYQLTNQPEKEFQALVDAASGYLDLDNLSMADSIIQKAKNISRQDVTYIQKLKELGLITNMRFNIRNGSYDFKNNNVESLEKTITESDLFMMTNFKNDNSFLNRQKFKILADMGVTCSELNPKYKYPLFEIKALNYIDKEKALGNYQDINRLNHIEGKFRNNLDSENAISINRNTNTAVNNQSKSWSLNSGGYQSRIDANPDLIIAGRVYEDITKGNSVKAVNGLDQIQIRQGEVIIPQELKDKETIDEINIQRVEGVKRVRITNKMPAK
jgi:tetratricopeptide (TPR) repeat protein